MTLKTLIEEKGREFGYFFASKMSPDEIIVLISKSLEQAYEAGRVEVMEELKGDITHKRLCLPASSGKWTEKEIGEETAYADVITLLSSLQEKKGSND